MKIAIMTGGGDAPGLNGVIESTSRALLGAGHQVLGIRDGFEGIFDGVSREISLEGINGIHSAAGTYLGTSNRCGVTQREKEFIEKFKKLGVAGMVVAGGDGTFAGLAEIARAGFDIPLIGVPKTIDNDLSGTEITFGFDTACSVVADAVDALRVTADAHRRIMIVEAMGRTAGWIALGGGLASYADVILIPERPYSRAKLLDFVRKRQSMRARGLMVVVSEGASAEGESAQVAFRVDGSPQAERYGGVAEHLARWLEKETKWEARHVVLGHLQRATHPTTTDRFLTVGMGVEVARMVKDGAWGQAVVYRGGRIARAPITDLQGPARLVEPGHRWIAVAQSLGLFV